MLKLTLGTTMTLVIFVLKIYMYSYKLKSSSQQCSKILKIFKYCEICKKNTHTQLSNKFVIPHINIKPY